MSLVEQLKDPDPEVRAFAAYYLKNLGSESDIEPLIVATGDPAPAVRQSAVHSLAVLGYRTGQRRVVAHVEYALGDESPDVRREAAVALGNWLAGMIGDERTVRALLHALRDPDLAEHAAFALESIYRRKNCYDLVRPLLEAQGDEDPVVREKVRSILEKNIKMADE
jgi:HEAT repeat protein